VRDQGTQVDRPCNQHRRATASDARMPSAVTTYFRNAAGVSEDTSWYIRMGRSRRASQFLVDGSAARHAYARAL
jgi:hypothetical protein